MEVTNLDHLVLTCRDLDATVEFYTRVLGMRLETFGEGRLALHYGSGEGAGKINLHQAGREFEPKAAKATPGSADLCFLVDVAAEEVIATLESLGVQVELGPATRTGARGAMVSVYFRDPDGNLIEVARRA